MLQGNCIGSSIHTCGIVVLVLCYTVKKKKLRKCLIWLALLNKWLRLKHSVYVSWLQVNANGSVMSSDIVGSIKLKTMLSGMPELRLGLNDRVLFALTGRAFKASF